MKNLRDLDGGCCFRNLARATSNNLARFERYLQYRTDIVRTTYVQVLVLYYIKTKIRYNNEVKHTVFFFIKIIHHFSILNFQSHL